MELIRFLLELGFHLVGEVSCDYEVTRKLVISKIVIEVWVKYNDYG